MSSIKLIVEVMDTNYQWNDITTDSMPIEIDTGLPQARAAAPKIGKCKITLNNRARTYTPDQNAHISALLECRSRIRVRATGPSMGKCLQIQQTRTSTAVDLDGFRQSASVVTNINDVVTISYQARAQYDSQFNNDRIKISNGSQTWVVGTPTYTNKWVAYSFAQTFGAGGVSLQCVFDNAFPITTGSNAKTIEYKNISLTINGGANVLVNGDFSNGFTSWQTYHNSGAGSCTATVIDDYQIKFNGLIEDIKPSPFANAGLLDCEVHALDFTSVIDRAFVDLALQKNQRGDQLNALALKQLSSYQSVILLDKPVRYYRMNATSGTTEVDVSGNGQNATYSGTVGYSQAGAIIGDTDTAISYNGTTTQLSVPGLTSMVAGTAWSIECWINITALPSVGNFPGIFANQAAGVTDKSIILFVDSSGNLDGGFYADSIGFAVISTGVWYHVVWTYDGATSTTYLNGVLKNSALHGPYTGNNTDFRWGNWASTFINGIIDEGAIYNYVLSAGAVARHYNAGIAQYNLARIPGVLQDTGKETFAVTFDQYNKASTSILQVATDSADSEYGVSYFDFDGTFRFAANDNIPKRINNTPALTLSDAVSLERYEMHPIRDPATLRNRVVLTWHPRQIVQSVIVLGSINSPVAIPPINIGGVPGSISITLTFRDPTSAKSIGGDSVITPLVAGTDYVINSRADNTGISYTNSSLFAIGAIVVSASQITIQLLNYSTDYMYALTLQVRGYGVYTLDPQTVTATDNDSIVTKQDSPYPKDMPYTSDGNWIGSLASYLVNRYKNPFLEVPEIVSDYQPRLNGVDLLTLNMMDIVSITDTQSGLSNAKHIIIGSTLEFVPTAGNYLARISFQLERLDQTQYWILQDAVYGTLGSTTALYI